MLKKKTERGTHEHTRMEKTSQMEKLIENSLKALSSKDPHDISPWEYFDHVLNSRHENKVEVIIKAMRLYRIWLTHYIVKYIETPHMHDPRKMANFWILMHLHRTQRSHPSYGAEQQLIYRDMMTTCLALNKICEAGDSACFLSMLREILEEFPEGGENMLFLGEKLMPALSRSSAIFSPEMEDKKLTEYVHAHLSEDLIVQSIKRFAVGPRMYRIKGREYISREVPEVHSNYSFLLSELPLAPECVLYRANSIKANRGMSVSELLLRFVKT
jgi:hypothetical protein